MAAKLALNAVVFATAVSGDALAASQLSQAEQQVWRSLQPSILIISQAGVSRGSAACIRSGGFYLAHQNSVRKGPIDGVTFEGQTYPMHLVANDGPTGLVLLQVDGDRVPRCTPIRIADEDHARQGTLLAVLSSGPVRADIGHPNIVATYAATNQSVLLNEIRFAAPPQMLTGALLFDDRGNLVGVLGATLPKAHNIVKLPLNSKPNVVGAESAPGGGRSAGIENMKLRAVRPLGQSQVGPAALNVAYAISPLLLNRVVAGFLSPTHDVLHPALGAVCTDDLVNGVSQGVVIRKINRGSGAAKAGLQVGDIILNIEGAEIHDVVDYARAMLAQEVGHRVTLAIRRGTQTIPIEAVVGRVTDPARLKQELNQSGA
ncbi:MAG: PDZ domain-containing protein [Fimbriimonadaceae bacterium]